MPPRFRAIRFFGEAFNMLKEITAALSARTGGSCTVGIVGGTGAGKTSLVRGIARALSLTLSEDGHAEGSAGELRLTLAEGFVSCDAAILVSPGFSPAGDILAERECAEKLRGAGIPFAALVNGNPSADSSAALCTELHEALGVPVCAADCLSEDESYEELLSQLLLAFPVLRIDVELPAWMCALPAESESISAVLDALRAAAPAVKCLADCSALEGAFSDGEVYCEGIETDASCGTALLRLAAKEGAFYRVLSAECGEDLSDDLRLMSYVRSLREAKKFSETFSSAFARARAEGYGIVRPCDEETELRPPELIRRGGRCAVKLSADAPSYHIVRVDVHSEVTPVTGDAARSEEIAKGIVEGYERDPQGLWNTDMFGKTFREMVREGLVEKTVPEDARAKLRRALERIANEGKGGVLCILL